MQDDVNMFLGGIAQGATGLGKYAEDNKPLSPFEQDAAEIASLGGTEDAQRQVAVRRKLIQAGHLPDQTVGSNRIAPTNPAGGMESLASPVQTRQDYHAAMQVAPFVNKMGVAGINGQTRRDVANANNDVKLDITDRNNAGKGARLDKALTAKEEHDQRVSDERRKHDEGIFAEKEKDRKNRVNIALINAENRIDAVRERGSATRDDLKFFEDNLRDLQKLEDTYAKEITSNAAALFHSPAVEAAAQAKLDAIQERKKEVQEMRDHLVAQFKMHAPRSQPSSYDRTSQTQHPYAPQNLPQAGAPGSGVPAPRQFPQGAVQGGPPDTAWQPPPGAVRQTNKTGAVRYRLPDGQIVVPPSGR